jgi:hypothetical protein
VVNLLEEPFLPYAALGDFWLPEIDAQLVASAPDPSVANYHSATQEFVRVYAVQRYEDHPTEFYTTFLGTVLFRDAFFDGQGDDSLLPGFNLEIWGVPTTSATYLIVHFDPSPDDGADVPVIDNLIVVQRFQKGVMRYDSASRNRSAVPLGIYVRALMTGEALPELAEAAQYSPLWSQYNPDAVNWVDRPDDSPDTNLVLAFVREDEEFVGAEPPSADAEAEPTDESRDGVPAADPANP